MIDGDGWGRVHTLEKDVFAEPWPRLNGRYPVIYNHSAASDAREASGWSLPSVRKMIQTFSDDLKLSTVAWSGVMSMGAGGLPAGSAFGLPTWRGRVEEAITVHNTVYGSSGKVGLAGTSMGTMTSLIYALEHPTNVRWMVLCSPVPLLKEVEAGNIGGLASLICTAWNVASHSLPAKADIYTRIMAGELGTIPILWIEASDDGFTNGSLLAKYTQLIAATGGHHHALGPVGHGEGTAAAMNQTVIEEFIREFQ